jgi:Tfp pilus assembly ATPase PilU
VIAKAIEENQTGKIQQFIAESSSFYKMVTLNQSLFRLLTEGKISEEEAMSISNNPNDLKIKIKTTGPAAAAPEPEKKVRKF